jgi:uncharacterized caspase-like protein
MDRRGFISGLAVAAALAGFTSAAAVADGRRVGASDLIGNGAYRSVPALPNSQKDAGDVAATLRRLGFVVTLVTNASFDEMRRGLIALGRDAAGADMATVYFAGHGMEINGENWLIPVDAELKRDTDAANEAIGLQSAIMQVSSTVSLGLVVLDACRNNPFAAKMNRSLAVRGAAVRGLGRIEPVGNVLLACAARDGTTAFDGDGRNSPFAAALLYNIETSGVEVTFVFRNVRDDVMEATRNEQQPFVYGSLSRKAIYLAGLPPSSASTTDECDACGRGSRITGARNVGTRNRSRAGWHQGDHGTEWPRPGALDLANDGRRHLQIPRRGRPRHALTRGHGHRRERPLDVAPA